MSFANRENRFSQFVKDNCSKKILEMLCRFVIFIYKLFFPFLRKTEIANEYIFFNSTIKRNVNLLVSSCFLHTHEIIQ